MKDTLYLIFDEYGFLEARKSDKFNLKAKTRAVRLTITIPDEAFRPSGMMSLTAEVPIEMVLHPVADIAAEVEEP